MVALRRRDGCDIEQNFCRPEYMNRLMAFSLVCPTGGEENVFRCGHQVGEFLPDASLIVAAPGGT